MHIGLGNEFNKLTDFDVSLDSDLTGGLGLCSRRYSVMLYDEDSISSDLILIT